MTPEPASHPVWVSSLPPLVARAQAGGALLLMAAALMVVGGTALAVKVAQQVRLPSQQQQVTQAKLLRVQHGLRAFAASHGRLPCPAGGAAGGTATEGQAQPNAATLACTNPDGTLPWHTLGLARDDAVDAWGRVISYRVATGAAGVTATAGTDLTACDSVEPTPVAPVGPAFACAATHDVLPTAVLAARNGLIVQVDGIAQAQVAWVAISHGPTGLGAWLPAGGRMTLPVAGDEANNAAGAPAFFAQRVENTLNLDPATAAAHFDDVVLFETLASVIAASGRSARNWPESAGPPSSTPTSEVIATLLDPSAPQPINTKGNGSGLTSIDIDGGSLGTVRLTSTGGEISTNGPYNALGVCSSGCGTGNDSARALASGESLSFRLATAGKTMQSVSLGLLGLSSTASTVAVSVTFKRNGTTLSSSILSASVSTTFPSTPQLTNLTPTPVQVFDEVVISPSGSTTRFYVATVGLCASSTTCN